MTRKQAQALIVSDNITDYIYLLRGQKVMLSMHLAALYGVEPRALVQAVKRNQDRFPADFMFQLTQEEYTSLKSQIVISKRGGLRRATPYAFTEQGVAMLSSVLKSKRAIQVNIAIMRTFAQLRHILTEQTTLARRLDELEAKNNEQFKLIFEALDELMEPPQPPRRQIGFSIKERRAHYRARRRQA